jgi:lipoprotein signal peptidase
MRVLIAIAGIVALDQVSKAFVLGALEPGRPVEILDGFLRLTLTHNDGGAFGLFAGFGGVLAFLATGSVWESLGCCCGVRRNASP